MIATERPSFREPLADYPVIEGEWMPESSATSGIPEGEWMPESSATSDIPASQSITNPSEQTSRRKDLIRAISANVVAARSLAGASERAYQTPIMLHESVRSLIVARSGSSQQTFVGSSVDNNTRFADRVLIVPARPESATDQETAASPSPIASLLLTERSRADIQEECIPVANAALQDALTLVRRTNLSGTPRVMFSDDGILTLQWHRGDYGVALLFAGDGIASIAFSTPRQFYAENGIEMLVSEDFPIQFTAQLTQIVS